MMRSLAQLYAALRAVAAVHRHDGGCTCGYQPEPTAEDRILVAQNHVQLGRHREALPWVRGALKRPATTPPESWYQLELAIHFELDDHRAALPVLKAMVARWPDRLRYWEMMAGAHQELNQDADALAALMAAYNGGLIDRGSQAAEPGAHELYVDAAVPGGAILGARARGRRGRSQGPNLQLLLQAWTAAREFERAAEVIDRLAPLTATVSCSCSRPG
jgi:tetratricopeptide (TPR) repeat protein